MSCKKNASNYERTKMALINVNRWKSNFISLWEKFGVFKDVDGVRCFDYYDIDGNDEGHIKMSKHLKQPTLHTDVQDDDLEWVHLFFSLGKLVVFTPESVTTWREELKLQLESYTFDKLVFTIANGVVTTHAFYVGEVEIDNPFLNALALWIAEHKNLQENDFAHNAPITLAEAKSAIDTITYYSIDYDGRYLFDLSFLEREVASYLMKSGIGTDILDQLVVDGVIVGRGDVSSGTMDYALPVDTARKMNGYSFVELVEKNLDFDYKQKSSFWDFFIDILGFVLVGVAIFFQQYWLAGSLLVSQVASMTGSKALKVLATVLSLYGGDPSAFLTMGASEAISLLMNVYGLYMELKYTPTVASEAEPSDNDQALFYRAPYGAYSQLYCYEALTSISLSATP